jgi:hypothetical protein
MPPKSRKRNKGKERKAKKADKVELERANANGFWQGCLSAPVGCLHGNDIAILNDHPVSKFMDEFFIHWIRKQKGIALILQDMLQTHAQVWMDGNHRELATQTFVSIGTNMLLAEDIKSGALSMAKTILVLEHYDSREGLSLASSFHSRTAASKRRELERGSISIERDLLKFYRKRLSCKCLKRMHLEARKTTPKMGKCYNCGIEKERVDLSVCSKCMVSQYCSRECQVARWPRHKNDCAILYQYKLKKKKQQRLAEEVSKERKYVQENKQIIAKEQLIGQELKMKPNLSNTESEMLKDNEERLAKLEMQNERRLAVLDSKCLI